MLWQETGGFEGMRRVVIEDVQPSSITIQMLTSKLSMQRDRRLE
jgi:hypothetical protein